ncbi:ECF transporter S component [Neobacillus sp. PS3-12]|jgi:energy-coupling factor transport system substrate-specific component|uniref:ECF transporter S component n=1 Tax=Neobacillus sp. PS3-12 TaxID=3070677 RepID=UPI0027DFA4C3|nr:ECF transporter S component [Neobacillus sp. PS3-12]WML52837.1 ECF transporter S component [Neobacillus sp. PS3-12]
MHIHRILKNILLFILLAVILCLSLIWQNHYIGLSICFVVVSMVFLLYRFEKRKIEAGELVLLAVLAAIAAVGRVPFASIPSVQPTTFVILMSGFVFGAESGFVIGATAALASNMILGQGPWTPWQMAAWGLVGFTAGLLRHTSFMKRTWGRIIFGIVWGFLFGWIMNIWGFFSFAQSEGTMSIKALISYFAASSLFDSMHAISNIFFLLIFGNIWIKNLSRFKKKYGLFDEK